MSRTELRHHIQTQRRMLESERAGLDRVIEQIMPLVWKSRGRIAAIGREMADLDALDRMLAGLPA